MALRLSYQDEVYLFEVFGPRADIIYMDSAGFEASFPTQFELMGNLSRDTFPGAAATVVVGKSLE